MLYPDAAPMAVQNFVGLARSGYYDNTVIWRAQYGFAVQGGDAGGTGSGGATIWSNNPYPLEADGSLCEITAIPMSRSPPMPRRAGCPTWITPIPCLARYTRAWMWWIRLLVFLR